MPEPPPGERELRALADRFIRAEAGVLLRLAEAATGDRREATREALELLAALRGLDYRGPVFAAYLAEHPRGSRTAVRDLAGSLGAKLHAAVLGATDAARHSFARVTLDTLDEHAEAALIAVVDRRGARWSLGRYAEMTAATIGRSATSRGVADATGGGGTVTVDVGECDVCAPFAGEAVVGRDPLPPYHPNCTCTVSAA